MSTSSERFDFARQLAAQAWCKDATKHKVMDVELAEEFAKILVKETYRPNLGCATTRELLEEITVRINITRGGLDYRTIDDYSSESEKVGL